VHASPTAVAGAGCHHWQVSLGDRLRALDRWGARVGLVSGKGRSLEARPGQLSAEVKTPAKHASSTKSRRAYPTEALQRAHALASEGRIDEAMAVAEQTWQTSGSRFPASFGLMLDLVARTSGKEAARERAHAELQRRDLSRRSRGLIETRLALLCLPIARMGEWAGRPLTPEESEAVQLAEAGLRHAGSIPATHAPLALIHAYKGDWELAMQHANAALRGAKVDDPRWSPYIALTQVVFGMVAAARGDKAPAEAFLTIARSAQPDSEWLSALEESLTILPGGAPTD
jgi:tetratricopeptide (TPR) repeat protein